MVEGWGCGRIDLKIKGYCRIMVSSSRSRGYIVILGGDDYWCYFFLRFGMF